MYSLQDREKFALRLVLISTVPFATIAIIMAVQAAV